MTLLEIISLRDQVAHMGNLQGVLVAVCAVLVFILVYRGYVLIKLMLEDQYDRLAGHALLYALGWSLFYLINALT